MRAHVADCEPCRAHYRRRQIFAELDPEAPSPEERIGRGLGLRRPQRPFVFPAAAMAVVALAALLFFVIRPASEIANGDGFTARGGPALSSPSDEATSTIAVYRVGDHTLLSASGAVRRDDELAFSYINGAHKPYLMIFGVDERGDVYWFYPAWTSAAENPSALRTDPEQTTVRLTEAIKHPLAGKQLTIHGLFLDQPRTVREIEAAIAEGHLHGMPGAIDQVFMFEVTP